MSPNGELRVPNGELRVVADVPGAFAQLVARQVEEELDGFDKVGDEVVPARERTFRLVLSGGSTARECYERLAQTPGLDWARIECLLGDERCVPADDQDANQRMIREALLARAWSRIRALSPWTAMPGRRRTKPSSRPSRTSISCISVSARTGTRPRCSRARLR